MLSKKLTTESDARSGFIATLQLIQTQRRKDAETQRKPKNNSFLSTSLNMLSKKLNTELTESTEIGRRLSASILPYFKTQRCKDAKNGSQYLLCVLCALSGLFAFPSRLCVFASLRFKKLQNVFQNASPLLCVLCALCGLFAFPCSLQADPWGKDADLARCRPAQASCTESQSGPGVAFSELFIRFHQEVISPADGPRSHFIPSSSQYTLDAVRRYGFFKGWMRGCDRLMRENDDPWVYKKCLTPAGQVIKYDPVK
jgi:putative component of membrane protein insertase Oxa1/YidC/SpoIIIJ protein YidD